MGEFLHLGATILCPHAGQAQPTSGSARVSLSGQPALSLAHMLMVAGCPFTTGSNPSPCTSVQWLTSAMRVTVEGSPALLSTSSGLCLGLSGPQGSPQMVARQMRVSGQ